jgi:hypothetical protein
MRKTSLAGLLIASLMLIAPAAMLSASAAVTSNGGGGGSSGTTEVCQTVYAWFPIIPSGGESWGAIFNIFGLWLPTTVCSPVQSL